MAAILLQSCAPSATTAENQQAEMENISLSELRSLNAERQQVPEEKDERIVLHYGNKSSGIEVTLDPDKDNFFLDLRGMRPAEKDTVVIADSTLMEDRIKDIRQVLAKFRQAQDLFYLDEYSKALSLLNETLEIAETADAYALKGTIHFMMGNKNATRENWNKAVQLNPDLPIPGIPELEEIIEEIIGEEEVAAKEQEQGE